MLRNSCFHSLRSGGRPATRSSTQVRALPSSPLPPGPRVHTRARAARPGLQGRGRMPAPHRLADGLIAGLVVDLEMGDRGLLPDLVRDGPLRDGPIVELGGGAPSPGPAPLGGQPDQERNRRTLVDGPGELGLAVERCGPARQGPRPGAQGGASRRAGAPTRSSRRRASFGRPVGAEDSRPGGRANRGRGREGPARSRGPARLPLSRGSPASSKASAGGRGAGRHRAGRRSAGRGATAPRSHRRRPRRRGRRPRARPAPRRPGETPARSRRAVLLRRRQVSGSRTVPSRCGIQAQPGPHRQATDQPLDRLVRRLGQGPGADFAAIVHRQHGSAVEAERQAADRAAEHPGRTDRPGGCRRPRDGSSRPRIPWRRPCRRARTPVRLGRSRSGGPIPGKRARRWRRPRAVRQSSPADRH